MKAMILNQLCNLAEDRTPLVPVEMAEPLPGDKEVLVKVSACGVCHTDLHSREWGINDEFPFLLGELVHQFVQQAGPFLAEDMGAGQAAVAADDDQAGDSVPDQVLHRPQTTVPFTELRAAGGTDDGTAAMQDAARRTGRLVAVGYQHLYTPAAMATKRWRPCVWMASLTSYLWI